MSKAVQQATVVARWVFVVVVMVIVVEQQEMSVVAVKGCSKPLAGIR